MLWCGFISSFPYSQIHVLYQHTLLVTQICLQYRRPRFDPWVGKIFSIWILLPGKSHGWRSLVGYSPWVAKSRTRLSDFTFSFHFHALEKEMATHSSVLAWRIPGTGVPGGLLSMGLHRVEHDWSNLAAAAAVCFFPCYHFWDRMSQHLMSIYYVEGAMWCIIVILSGSLKQPNKVGAIIILEWGK